MKDLLPPTLVTFIKDVLQAIIANELHARMMKSYVAHFRRRQSVTDLAHINSQFCHAQVAWVSRFPVSWRGVGHGLHAIFCSDYALRYSTQKLKGSLPRFERKSMLRSNVIIAFELPRLSSHDLYDWICLLSL